jgi:hypothetical protein
MSKDLSKFECAVCGYVLSMFLNVGLMIYVLNSVHATHKKQIEELKKPNKELLIKELKELIKSLEE